jgi:signal transduction histidine kinase
MLVTDEPADGNRVRNAANGALFGDIARDIAHELRGPVQSIVVNLEVARLKIRKGSADEGVERLAVIEQEVMRMHKVADAFVSLLRPDEAVARPVPLESILAGLDPLVEVLARCARVELDRPVFDPALLALVRSAPASLGILRLLVDAIAAAGAGGRIVVSAGPVGAAVELRVAIHGAAGHAVDTARLGRQADVATSGWLADADGTAAVHAGSDAGDATVSIGFARPA